MTDQQCILGAIPKELLHVSEQLVSYNTAILFQSGRVLVVVVVCQPGPVFFIKRIFIRLCERV